MATPPPGRPPVPPFAAPGAATLPRAYAEALTVRAPASRGLGIAALVLGAVAAAVAPLVGGWAAFVAAAGTSQEWDGSTASAWSWSMFTPVREWFLVGEIAFWVGTAVGIWALAQGIVAVASGRGVAAGAIGIVLAVLGPVIFALAVGGAIALALG